MIIHSRRRGYPGHGTYRHYTARDEQWSVMGEVTVINGFGREPVYVQGLWVEPDYRRQGIATQLLHAVKGHYARFTLACHPSNTEAQGLYRKLSLKQTEGTGSIMRFTSN